jgi:Putative zinc-finger
MVHQTAVNQHFADRYLLGELSDLERDEFEEHYFVCTECAADVQAGTLFVANARAVFRDRRNRPRREGRESIGWFGAFRLDPMLSAVATVSVALCIVLGYAASLRNQLKHAGAPEIPETITIRPLARGAETPGVVSRGTPLLLLRFVLPPESYQEYSYDVEGKGGSFRAFGRIPSSQISEDEVSLAIPASTMKPGVYRVTLVGTKDGKSVEISQQQIEVRAN